MIWGHSFGRGHGHRPRDNRWNAMLSGGPHDHTMFCKFYFLLARLIWLIFTTVPTYRGSRHNADQRGGDDGTNPLLLRYGREGNVPLGSRAPEPLGDWMDTIRASTRFASGPNGPMSFLSSIISAMSRGVTPVHHRQLDNGGLHLTISRFPPGNFSDQIRPSPGLLGLIPPPGPRNITETTQRGPREDPAQAVAFIPAMTTTRWQDEARLLFGSSYIEKAQRVINSVLKLLVPPAVEAQKALKIRLEKKLKEEQLAKEKEKAEREEAEKAEEEEKVDKVDKADEADEADKAEKAEQEEAAPAMTAATAAEAVNASHSDQPGQQERQGQSGSNETMEGIEQTAASDIQAAPGAAAAPRVTTRIRGRDLDITGLGIDLEYLEALPEEFREEVLMQQVAEQRSQAVAAGQEPTDISREFLEALPPNIRNELLQQEAQDRRRREREEARHRSVAGNAPAQAEDMDAASFLASLDPELRTSVLMEQDEEMLSHLPDSIAAEARALGGDRRLNQFREITRLGRNRTENQQDTEHQHTPEKHARKQVPQILDKSGVATMLRLMFLPVQGSTRQSLNEILKDICENRQNRAEVISILLTILQDGSADNGAVERCFSHLTNRSKCRDLSKSPQAKRLPSGQASELVDVSPLMVVQQCLSTLLYLTFYNAHISGFFLSEHETVTSTKSRAGRKGKGKEIKAAKYPLNALLSLLDKQIIIESTSVMEQLASLLNTITLPLNVLIRKESEKSILGSQEAEDKHGVPQTSESGRNPANQANPGNTTMSSAVDTPSNTTESAENRVVRENDIPPQGENRHSKDDDKQQEEKLKKPRLLHAPDVPEENLCLVVNILTARECTSKTFRDTLSMILNLSALPGAKDIFGKELVRTAQSLAGSILRDLDDLSFQISRAESGTEIQGLALSKFSPATSDQSKLLRVLTALDYLFDPKRPGSNNKLNKRIEELGEDSMSSIITTLQSSHTFDTLWSKLSETLTAIRKHGNLFSVATILLPLVEALMVVCKNTTLKNASVAKNLSKDFSLSSPQPENRIESLFFAFTEEHRKVLNDLVRHNPKLMSGWFSLLVKNSKVLEFDNKRNYFTRKLHSRNHETRHQHPALQLAVRREQVFLDSFKSLYFKSSDEMKYGKLSIRFHGEEGVDAGGVTREWFQVLSRQMFNPDYALFIPVASDCTTFHPNRLSSINQEHLMFFKFIGRIIGKALYEGRVLDCHFSRAVYKRILGKPVSVKDMETLDLDYYKSLLWMLENDITDIITETFSLETEAFGVTQIVDLIDNGRSVPVTEENKHEYVRLVVEYRLTGSVQEQLEHFLKGNIFLFLYTFML